jgi:hypothetical protein
LAAEFLPPALPLAPNAQQQQFNPAAMEFHPRQSAASVTTTFNPAVKEFRPIAPPPVATEEKKMETCTICYDELDAKTGRLECNAAADPHVFCQECFVDQVKSQVRDENMGKFIQAKRRIVCSLCLPTCVEFDDAFIAVQAGSAVFAQYRKANETAIEVEVCRREKERSQKAIEEMRNEKESTTQRHRIYIAENILTLCCPRCKVPFIDFEGCFAVSCSACACSFCAWCFLDCGSDAHPHVSRS